MNIQLKDSSVDLWFEATKHWQVSRTTVIDYFNINFSNQSSNDISNEQ